MKTSQQNSTQPGGHMFPDAKFAGPWAQSAALSLRFGRWHVRFVTFSYLGAMRDLLESGRRVRDSRRYAAISR